MLKRESEHCKLYRCFDPFWIFFFLNVRLKVPQLSRLDSGRWSWDTYVNAVLSLRYFALTAGVGMV